VKGVAIGGCVYRSLVHTRHAVAVAQAYQLLQLAGASLVKFDYMHTSDLRSGRRYWLQRQIDDRELDLAVTIDSDSMFDPESLVRMLPYMHGDRAIGVAPFVIGGTDGSPKLNIIGDGWSRWGSTELRALDSGLPVRCLAGGFGLAVFNLTWFRRRWSGQVIDYDRDLVGTQMGEDIELCMAARTRGADIVALPISTVHMDIVQRPGLTVAIDRDGARIE
jgi:hypothetical protein